MWLLNVNMYWLQILLGFAFGYAYYYMKVYAMTHYGKDYFRTPKVFELLVEKYMVLEQRYGLVKGTME